MTWRGFVWRLPTYRGAYGAGSGAQLGPADGWGGGPAIGRSCAL